VEAQLAQLWASYEASVDTDTAQEALDAVIIAFARVYEAWIPVEVDGKALVRVRAAPPVRRCRDADSGPGVVVCATRGAVGRRWFSASL
jgi:hypothetical protein